MPYHTIHLGDMLEELGEDKCNDLIANFSCPLDPDIEYFLHKKAILFHRLGLSRTYFVYSSYQKQNVLVGYFALAGKVLYVRNGMSVSARKKLIGTKSADIKEIPVFLIGQLSKNFTNGLNKLINGEELLGLALKKIIEAQHITGGRIILVECAENPNLMTFYSKHGFRFYEKDSDDGLLRYIREINGITVT